MDTNSHKKITVWDSDESYISIDTVILWNGFSGSDNKSVVSVQKYIEEHADGLRYSYLKFIYDLGNKEVGKKSIVENLNLRKDFSYWWMTLLAEKCNFAKSPQIDDAIKVLALEKWLVGREISQLELVTSNFALAEVLEAWCVGHGVLFTWKQLENTKNKQSSSIRQLYRYLPPPLQAIAWLVHRLVTHRHLIGAGISEWKQSDATTAFVSYFFNLVPDVAKQGRYESRYWANLPDALRSRQKPTRWLHIWVKDAVASSSDQAERLIELFNQSGRDQQVHATLDSFLGIRPVLTSLQDWLRLCWNSRGLKKTLAMPTGTGINLWPLLHDDWRNSLYGPTAISNLLMLNLFDEAFEGIPQQHKGAYLLENQGWEFGFVAVWNRAKHQGLIGVPHSTVRFWDLRYFFDPRSYQQRGNSELPLPHQIAVNGPVAKRMYLQGGYPSDQIVEVEALRYLHLAQQNQREKDQKTIHINSGKHHLLVLGDYLPENTRQQMALLEQVVDHLRQWEVVIKPHPACPVSLNDYPELLSIGASVTEQPIAELLPQFSVAYTSAVTSAAVDAYCAGLHVISILDFGKLNLSPLRGIDGIDFVSTPAKLIAVLKDEPMPEGTKPFFHLDSGLPRWQNLFDTGSEH